MTDKDTNQVDGTERTKVGGSGTTSKRGDGIADLLAKILNADNKARAKGEKEQKKKSKEGPTDDDDSSGDAKYYTVPGARGPTRRRIRTDSQYELADIDRSKGVDQLTAERLMAGESMGKALSGSLNDFTKSLGMGLKKTLDPISLLNKVPGIGKSLAAMAGKNRPDDVAYLTGVIPKDDESLSTSGGLYSSEESEEKPNTAKKVPKVDSTKKMLQELIQSMSIGVPSAENETNVDKNGRKLPARDPETGRFVKKTAVKESELGVLVQIRDLIQTQVLKQDINDNFDEEDKTEEDKKHDELIKALLEGDSSGTNATATSESKSGGGLLDKIGKGASSLGKAALTMVAMAGAVWVMSKALKGFADVSWESVGKGAVVLISLAAAAKVIGDVGSKGALLMVAMAGSLWILSESLSKFADLEWETLAKAGVTLGGIALIMAGLGAFAAPIALGAGALVLMSGALYIFGKSMESIGESMAIFTENIKSMAEIDAGNLFKVAGGITALGAAMIAFGASQMVTALENLVTNFLSIGQDSPVEQLEKIGKSGAGIEKAATGMEKLADAINKFANIDNDILSKTVDSIEDIADALKDLPENTTLTVIGKANIIEGKTASKQPTKNGKVLSSASKQPTKNGKVLSSASKQPTKNGKVLSSASKQNEKISGTLSGVSGEDIRNHPNFKKYYDEALSAYGDKQSAYEEATMQVKDDMLRTQQTNTVKPIPQPDYLSSRMNESVKENNELSKGTSKSSPVVVNAPSNTVVNNNGGSGGTMIQTGIRNDDPMLTRLQYQNYRPV